MEILISATKNIKKTLFFLNRIKWKNVFIAFIIVLGFCYGVTNFVQDVVNAYPNWIEEKNEKYLAKQLEKYDQVEVIIKEGDTAWSIQRQLTPNEADLRDTLWIVEQINERNTMGKLIPGEKITFLKYKEE